MRFPTSDDVGFPQTTDITVGAGGRRLWTRNKWGLCLLTRPPKVPRGPRFAGRHPNKPGGVKNAWSSFTPANKAAWSTWGAMCNSFKRDGTPFTLSGYQAYLRATACGRISFNGTTTDAPLFPIPFGDNAYSAGYRRGQPPAYTVNAFDEGGGSQPYIMARITQPFLTSEPHPKKRLFRVLSFSTTYGGNPVLVDGAATNQPVGGYTSGCRWLAWPRPGYSVAIDFLTTTSADNWSLLAGSTSTSFRFDF